MAAGGRAAGWAADLADPATPAALFDRAEAALGPVEILVNNADAWAGDTFLPDATDRLGRRLEPVSAAGHDHAFAVNSRATALLIAEFARRHVARGATWGRIVGLTTGGAPGFPEEVSYGASKNALESYTVAAAGELGRFGVTANVLCPPATDTGWVTPDLAAALLAGRPARPRGHAGGGGRGGRVPRLRAGPLPHRPAPGDVLSRRHPGRRLLGPAQAPLPSPLPRGGGLGDSKNSVTRYRMPPHLTRWWQGA